MNILLSNAAIVLFNLHFTLPETDQLKTLNAGYFLGVEVLTNVDYHRFGNDKLLVFITSRDQQFVRVHIGNCVFSI